MKLSQIKKTPLLLILLSFFVLNCPTEKKDDSTTVAALAVLSKSATVVAVPTITSFTPTSGVWALGFLPF